MDNENVNKDGEGNEGDREGERQKDVKRKSERERERERERKRQQLSERFKNSKFYKHYFTHDKKHLEKISGQTGTTQRWLVSVLSSFTFQDLMCFLNVEIRAFLFISAEAEGSVEITCIVSKARLE